MAATMSPNPARNRTVKNALLTAGRCAKTAIKRVICLPCLWLVLLGSVVGDRLAGCARGSRWRETGAKCEGVVPCGRLRGQSRNERVFGEVRMRESATVSKGVATRELTMFCERIDASRHVTKDPLRRSVALANMQYCCAISTLLSPPRT